VTDLPADVIRIRPRLRVIDCQGERTDHLSRLDYERPQTPYRAQLMDQLHAVKTGLDSGLSVAEIRRFECERSMGIIRSAAGALALFETPSIAANALRSLADEIDGSDAA
jgi:hypothetical protein